MKKQNDSSSKQNQKTASVSSTEAIVRRAADYAKRFDENPSPQELVKVAHDMLMETKTLAEKRRAKSKEALFAILDEIDQKWRAFVRKQHQPGVRIDGFEKYVEAKMGFIYPYWQEYRRA